MTNPTNALAEIQDAKRPRWWNLLLGVIAGLVVALLLAILAPFLVPSPSAANLSNGAFCIQAKGYDGEFTGMAGAKNCGSGESEPPVVIPPVKAYGQITVGRGQFAAPGYRFLLTVRDNLEGATSGLRVSCHASTVDDGAAFKTVTASIPATGVVEVNCPFNTPGAQVWVSIEGHAYTKTVW